MFLFDLDGVVCVNSSYGVLEVHIVQKCRTIWWTPGRGHSSLDLVLVKQ